MDKAFLFSMLLDKAEKYALDPLGVEDEQITLFPPAKEPEIILEHLYRVMYEVNKRKHITFPDFDFYDESAVDNLRELYKDNVPIISAILGILRPQEYLFYNPLKFEDEIFEGVKYFSDVVPEFDEIEFEKVGNGTNRFQRYLTLNKSLIKMAKYFWPGMETPYYFIEGMLYHGLGPMFTEYSDYRRYWVLATKPDYFDSLDETKEVIWSGRKGMQAGDKIFIYRTSPVSAITDIYEAVEDSYFHPVSSWDGFWLKIKHVCKVPPIKFSEMRKDQVLRDWWVIKKQFTGTVTDPMSFNIYNRFLELLPEKIKKQYKLEPEPVAEHGISGVFDSEKSFEDMVITPLLKRFDIKHDRQYIARFYVGTQVIRGRIDYVLYHKNKPYSLIENKLRILNDSDLAKAVNQAKSYSLQIGVDRFVVASPEGYWFYKLKFNSETQIAHISSEKAKVSEDLLAQNLLP